MEKQNPSFTYTETIDLDTHNAIVEAANALLDDGYQYKPVKKLIGIDANWDNRLKHQRLLKQRNRKAAKLAKKARRK